MFTTVTGKGLKRIDTTARGKEVVFNIHEWVLKTKLMNALIQLLATRVLKQLFGTKGLNQNVDTTFRGERFQRFDAVVFGGKGWDALIPLFLGENSNWNADTVFRGEGKYKKELAVRIVQKVEWCSQQRTQWEELTMDYEINTAWTCKIFSRGGDRFWLTVAITTSTRFRFFFYLACNWTDGVLFCSTDTVAVLSLS